MRWSALTHKLYKDWSQLDLENQKILVLLSGGADSVALLLWLAGLPKSKRPRFEVLHFHHGESENNSQKKYRDEASLFCEKLCQQLSLKLIKIKSKRLLQNEQQMRRFRREKALLYLKKYKFDKIVTAHHANDLLETRLFRVLRGTGLQGITSIQKQRDVWWRPLLDVSRIEIENELRLRKQSFCADPSNQDLKYERNWLRNELLPLLEKRRPGASHRLSQFFNEVCQSQSNVQMFDKECQISLSDYLTWSLFEQKRAIAGLFLALGIKNYTQNHVREVIKQLDSQKKRHRFVVGDCEWKIEPSFIQVSRC